VEAERLRFVVTVVDLGGQVETVRPDDSARLGIDSDLGEEVGVIEGLDQGRLSFTGRVLEITDDAVIEEQPHDMRAEDGDPYDERSWWVHGRGTASMVPGGSPSAARSQASMSSAR